MPAALPECSSSRSVTRPLVAAAEKTTHESRVRTTSVAAQGFRTVDPKAQAVVQRQFDAFQSSGSLASSPSDAPSTPLRRLQQVRDHLAVPLPPPPPKKTPNKPKRLGHFEDWIAALKTRGDFPLSKQDRPPMGQYARTKRE